MTKDSKVGLTEKHGGGRMTDTLMSAIFSLFCTNARFTEKATDFQVDMKS